MKKIKLGLILLLTCCSLMGCSAPESQIVNRDVVKSGQEETESRSVESTDSSEEVDELSGNDLNAAEAVLDLLQVLKKPDSLEIFAICIDTKYYYIDLDHRYAVYIDCKAQNSFSDEDRKVYRVFQNGEVAEGYPKDVKDCINIDVEKILPYVKEHKEVGYSLS